MICIPPGKVNVEVVAEVLRECRHLQATRVSDVRTGMMKAGMSLQKAHAAALALTETEQIEHAAGEVKAGRSVSCQIGLIKFDCDESGPRFSAVPGAGQEVVQAASRQNYDLLQKLRVKFPGEHRCGSNNCPKCGACTLRTAYRRRTEVQCLNPECGFVGLISPVNGQLLDWQGSEI